MYTFTFTRYDEEADEEVSYELEVTLYHEPTEYESGYLFKRGGFELEEVKCGDLDFNYSDQEGEEILSGVIQKYSLEPKEYHYRGSWL